MPQNLSDFPDQQDDLSDFPDLTDFPDQSVQPQQSYLSRAADMMFNAPKFITEPVGRFAESMMPGLDTSPNMARMKGFIGGAAEGAASLFSPANILTLGKSRLASIAAKGLGTAQTLHGAGEVLEGNTAEGLGDIGAGVLTGISGMRGNLNKIKSQAAKIEGPSSAQPEAIKISELIKPEVKPETVVIKKPTPALIAKYRQEGYESAGVDPNSNYPIMKLAQPTRTGQYRTWAEAQGAAKKSGMEVEGTVETGFNLVEPKPNLVPFGDEITLAKPNAVVVKKMVEQGFKIKDVTPDGTATFIPPSVLEPTGQASNLQEAYNLARGLSTSWDISAPFRQGLPLIARKEWRDAWIPMMKSLGSDNVYQQIMKNIEAKPLFQKRIDTKTGVMQPSFAEEAGLKLSDLRTWSNREEALMSTWAEKVPGVKASNRAYTSFLNKLRADTFESLIKDATNMGRDPKTDLVLARKIADFVNNASGRGSLGSLEQNSKLLTNMLFSPRLVAARIQMLNPSNYIMSDPFVRKQYWKSAAATATTWLTLGSLAKFAGADVSLDTNNADFGKIKIGDTRLDPAGGFQQYLVAFSRFLTGKTTSSVSGREYELGQGFRADTRKNVAERFSVNKLHPVLKFAYDMLDASEYKPFGIGDRIAQMYIPLIIQDTIELTQKDPSLLPLVIPVSTGMGTQTYGKEVEQSLIIPSELDITLGR